jgi:wobble nucleotide-excising tRNase
MIQSISILNVATFHPTTATTLNDLRQFNYIFGSNGTGKTTISRVIADAAFSTTCGCTWQNGQPLESVVLNRDFVEKNFDQMRGVFTLGEKEKDTEDKIKAAKEGKDKEQEKVNDLRHTLGGNDGTGGKKGELAQLESDARDKFWVPVEKIKKEKKLDKALEGFLGNKEKCKAKILQETQSNQ